MFVPDEAVLTRLLENAPPEVAAEVRPLVEGLRRTVERVVELEVSDQEPATVFTWGGAPSAEEAAGSPGGAAGQTPETGVDLCYLSLVEAAELVRTRQVSPVELTRAVLERAERLNPRLNAFISLMADEALAAARAAEAEVAAGNWRGPLHGIPVSVKDIFAVAGVPNTAGSKVFAGRVAGSDCEVVRRLKAAGAVIFGKNHLHEFAYGVTSNNPHYGPARNPWDPDRVPGGSSGGSGVAVGAGIGYGSMGSDTGGSIRIPAALCGVSGLKPTYGRVSRSGVFPLAWSLDHCGPLARAAADLAALLEAVAGFDPADPGSADVPGGGCRAGLTGDVRGVRVGIPTNFFFDEVAADVEGAVRTAIETLAGLGAEVREVALPFIEYAGPAATVIIMAEAAAVHHRLIAERAADYGADVRARLEFGLWLPAAVYLHAQRARRLILGQMLEVFRDVDVLVTPATPVTAPRVGQSRVEINGREYDVRSTLTRFTSPFNLVGFPALVVPCGFDHRGLPVGLQVVGRPFEEATVLRVGHAYQQATNWHRRRPPVG
jgi:aspartyl-tRNA(Asn)/glutamyl-tRNA(Gln) amidotransferase subunit A